MIASSEKEAIIKACHSDPTSAHLGINKTTDKIASIYFWSGLTKDVQEYIDKRTCEVCFIIVIPPGIWIYSIIIAYCNAYTILVQLFRILQKAMTRVKILLEQLRMGSNFHTKK